MTESAGQAPAGWYDDPHAPGRLRYFDGEMWTNHFHVPGKLPDIGSWLGTTFSVFREHWQGAVIIAVGTTLIGNLIGWFAFREIIGDLAIIDEEFVNFGASQAIAGVWAAIVLLLWQGFGWLALNRYLQRAHFQAAPSVEESLRRALRRMPRFIGVNLVLVAVGFVAIMAVVVALLVAPALGVVLGLALAVGLVWAWVKVSFLAAAVVAVPDGAPIWRSSADVSAGRFWGVLGRLLLVAVSVGIAGNVVTALTGNVGSPVDQDALADVLVIEGDEFRVRDFRMRELLPSGSDLGLFLVLSTLVGSATSLVTTSAFMRLYLDSGAPSDT